MSHKYLFPLASLLLAIALAFAGLVPVSAAPPSNDDFESATVVTEPLPFTNTIDASEATTAPDDPYAGGCGNVASVWYQFTPSKNMVIAADTFGSDYNTWLSVYVQTSEGLSVFYCDIGQALFTATAGVTYYFMIAAFEGEEVFMGGNLVFNVDQIPPPSNDDITSATVVIEPLPFSDTVDTLGATTAPDDPDCFGNGATVWYQFTPSHDMHIQLDTFGSDYDTTLSVYTGSPGSLTQIRCEDHTPTGLDQRLAAFTLEVAANQTYYIMVGAQESRSGGHLVFNVSLYEHLQAEIQIDTIGTVDKDGNAVIRGTLTCSRLAVLESVGSSLEQTRGKRVITGSFFLPFDFCGPELGEISWEVTVSPEDGRFKPGLAIVDIDESFFDFVTDESDRVEFTQEVRLKRK